MARYLIVGGAVVLRDPSGSFEYLYPPRVVEADGYTDASVAHAVSMGLLVEEIETASPAAEPSEEWTNAELIGYAKEHGIDLGDARNKKGYLAAIRG